MGKTSKTQGSQKKKVSKQQLQKLIEQAKIDQIQRPRRRLKKLSNRKQSSDQDFVPGKSDQEDNDFIDPQMVQQQQEIFQRFKLQNDQDIKKQKQQQQSKKKKNKLKNNQQIDKFIAKNAKSEIVVKQKPQAKVQLNLQQMFKQQKLRKQQQKMRQPSPQPEIQSQGQSDSNLLLRQQTEREKYYNQYQNNGSEQQLLKQAMKLSLQSAKKQKKKQQPYVHLTEFLYQQEKPSKANVQSIGKAQSTIMQNKQKVVKTTKSSVYSSVDMSEEDPFQSDQQKPKNKASKKPAKKTTKKEKVVREGPLAEEVVIFTGEFQPYTKDQLIELCQGLGAQTPKTLTVKATVLFQGSFIIDAWKRKIFQDMNTTKKSKQALQRGVKIYTSQKMDDYFISKTGKSLQQLFSRNKSKLDGFIQKPIADLSNIAMQIQIDNQNLPKNIQNSSQLWTDKHKPQTLDDVIGQSSQIKLLREWLADWTQVILRGNKKNVVPAKGFLPSGTLNSRAALLSGDPGLGKTTTARLLAQQLGYSVTQFNASDIRNKKGVQLIETTSYGIHSSSNLVKNLIIMDQVDGMSKGDRGGIAEIIGLIKSTTIPVICICNDRQSQKIRSLAGHCLDVKFHKPDKRMILRRLQQILAKQHGRASQLVLSRMIQTFQNDMRQILTYLQLMFKTKSNQLQINDLSKINSFSKDNSVMLTHFDSTRTLLNRGSLNTMTVRQKLDCYFIDSSFVPLMIHENYLGSMKKAKLSKKEFSNLVKANDGFVLGDLIQTRIRKEQDWGLMPSAGFMSSVYPSQLTAESLGFPQFPSWLGKFSSERKQKRLLRQLKHVVHCEVPLTTKNIRYGQAALMYQQINYLLKKQKIDQSLDFMQTYGINPTILSEVLLPLQYNPKKELLLSDVSPSVKTRLTKAFNKRHEDIKLKGKTKKITVAPEHTKYNDVLEQMSQDDFINDQDDEENSKGQNQEKKSKKDQKKAPKGKKK